MIVLDRTWRIESDAYQWILFEEGYPDKNGRIPRYHTTYHTALEDALARYYRRRVANIVNSTDMHLAEVIVAVQELRKELAALREVVAREVDEKVNLSESDRKII